MKKILSLLLALAMLLPACALADTVINLGAFQVSIPDSAYVETYEKVSGSVIASIIPDPDSPSGVYANINVTWGLASKEDITFTADEYAQAVLREAVNGLNASGVAISNPQVFTAEMSKEEGLIYLYYGFDADYTGLGVDLVTSLYMAQQCLLIDGDGMYTITFTADSEEGVLDLLEYFDSCML